ncbi:Hypothetical protein GLP15_782 [Giardia lamblia P15]|uniref:SEC7 domain-containing protein n=1 Tax=Giardia intestinalis (strain P15) TaxID=658858 RepID=E1EXX2_GIAIA|nr:Hypothetical protein GLP15_782 [Giardia lamblia P15]
MMEGQCIQDKIFQLMSLGAASLPENFPLFSYIQKTLLMMTRPCVKSCAPMINHNPLEAGEAGSLIALCVEILLSRDSSLSLLQIASDVLLLAFQNSPKEDISRGIVSLTGAILNRRLKISTTRLVLSLFHTIIRNNLHKSILTSTNTQGLTDDFSFEIVNLCVLAKLAMTDGHLDTGIVIYNEDLEASGVHIHTLVFFASFLMTYLVPSSELSRTPFYVSLTRGFPAWIPKRFLDGFECVSVLELLRETLCFFKQRLPEFRTFLIEQPKFVGEFITLATSLACSSREAYQVLRQIVVDITIILIEAVEEAGNLTSFICVTLFHCLNSLIVLPLFSKSVIFANLDCPVIPKAIGHLVLSNAYSCLDEDVTMELKRQKESLMKEMGSGSSKVERGSKLAVERAYFCLWSLLRVITGEKYRLYPLYLIKLTYLPSTSLLLYYLLDVLMNLASANNQGISGLALNCMINLYMHCLGVLVHASNVTCPISLSSIQSKIVEQLAFLGKIRGIGSSILSCGKTIRDTKPNTILSVFSEYLASNFTSKVITEPITLLPFLSGIVHPSVPFLLLFSKKGLAALDSTTSQDDYFYQILSSETIHSDMDELDLFRLCFRNFLLSGEGQEIERAMISISNAVARIINELPSDHRLQLIGHAPSLRILLGSIVVLTTECLSEKIAPSSKMTMSRFVSILMGSSQIKEYLSGNYQLSKQAKGQPVPLHDDLVSKFSSMYQRIRNAPLAVDRTIYDTLALPAGIPLPSSACIKLAERTTIEARDISNSSVTKQSGFINVFGDWCTSSSMLPGTMDQLISMTVHQTCLHLRTMEQLRNVLDQQESVVLNNIEISDSSLIEYYFHIYLLVQVTLTHFVSGVLAGTIGSGSLALLVDYSSGLYAACHAVYTYSLEILTPFAKSSNSILMSSLIERELISSSYLFRYFADQCEYLRLSEYMSASSPNGWIKLGSKLHSGGANHIYAALYGLSMRSFIQYSNYATEKWRAKNLNDVIMHMVRILISLHALNVISTSSLNLTVELDIYPNIKNVILSTEPLASLQSICSVFGYSDDAIASKALMCPFELCREVVTAFETKADYSVIIHDGIIKLVVRTADPKGIDTEDSSLLKHTAQISAIYMALMLLGSLKFYANVISYLAPHTLVVCLPEVTGLIDLAVKTTQAHSITISTSLQPVYSKLKPGQGNFKLETSVAILSICIYLILLKKLVEGIKVSSSCVSDFSLVYKRLEEVVYLEDTSIKYVSKSMIALMEIIYIELNSLDNNVSTLRNITLSYPQLCLAILHRYTPTDIFLPLLLDCIYELLCLNSCQNNILCSIFLSQLRSFYSTNLIILASQFHQLFRGEPISSEILKSRRSVTIMLPVGGKVVTLPPLASFFFGDVASPKSSEKSDDDAIKSVLSRIATALLPKKARDSPPAVTQFSINKETIERLAKFLATISSAKISQNTVIRFLSELGTDSFETLKASTAVPCDILCLYFSISIYHFLKTTYVTFDNFYLSLPLYSLEDSQNLKDAKDSDTATSNKVTQFVIPLLLPIFLVTRTLESTSNPLLWVHIANTLAFFARELACSDGSRAFFFQQVLLPIILLAQNTVPLTQFEKSLSQAPELVKKIASISKEVIKDITNTELRSALDYQLSVLGF